MEDVLAGDVSSGSSDDDGELLTVPLAGKCCLSASVRAHHPLCLLPPDQAGKAVQQPPDTAVAVYLASLCA